MGKGERRGRSIYKRVIKQKEKEEGMGRKGKWKDRQRQKLSHSER